MFQLNQTQRGPGRQAARTGRGRSGRRAGSCTPHLERLEHRLLLAGDVILEWNEQMLAANAADHSRSSPEQGGPVLTARAFAIVSAAMYDAYNSIERIGAPYLTKVVHAGAADSVAAVAKAAHDTLVSLYPAQELRFEAALRETLARIADGPAEDLGVAVGAEVALRILDERSEDGAAELMRFDSEYQPRNLPGFHQADPLHPNQGFYAPGAMHVLPFVLDSVDQFEARRLDDGTPEGRLAFLQSDEYQAAFDEVFAVGGDGLGTPTTRTAEQTLIGIYWGYDGRPGIGTPPRLYNQIARTVAVQQNNSVAHNARLFALLNLAQADAGLTSWNNKYDDDFWRPVVAIRQADSDGNGQTPAVEDWTPLGAPGSNPRPDDSNFTPPFPAYTSGHATFGAAAMRTLERFFGRDDIRFTLISDELNGITLDADGSVRPLVPRTFDSFTQAKQENGQSRIYLGIHWAFDRDDGIKTGDEVADFIAGSALQPKSDESDPFPHNTFDPLDVNDDGQCSPVDALRVINVLNGADATDNGYIDVNDDGVIAPNDALLIINFLMEVPPAGAGSEGEGSDDLLRTVPTGLLQVEMVALGRSAAASGKTDCGTRRELDVPLLPRLVCGEWFRSPAVTTGQSYHRAAGPDDWSGPSGEAEEEADWPLSGTWQSILSRSGSSPRRCGQTGCSTFR
ncbi:MAG: hypothetical protein J5I93_13040 [Pirellulaceae bacterium]|nr:hypothetical protein [Pirellulaceae bacterium]